MKNKLKTMLVALLLYSIGSYAQDVTKDSITLNQYGQMVESEDLDAQARNAIITFESKDGNYKFWMDNRVLFDGAYFFDNDTYNEIGNGVVIRRARLAIKTKLHKNWYGEIDMDFAGSQLELKDAYIKYTNDAGDLNV